MPKTIFDPGSRDSLVQRLHTLTPEREPQWGAMTAGEMVSHLIESCRLALGELPVTPVRTRYGFFPLNWLIVRWLPWPKSAPTAPELVARRPADWDRDIDALIALIRRFAECRPDRTWPTHPTLGRLSCASWGALMYRHFDHHFEQFGI